MAPAQGSTLERVWAFARFAISVLTLLLVMRLVSAEKIGAIFQRLSLLWFFVALLVYLPSQAVHAQRFRFIVAVLGKTLPFRRVLALHFIRLWFNQVLPTGFGGDAVKAFLLRYELGTSVAVRAAILDRVAGFMTLLACTALLFPLYAAHFSHPVLAVGVSAVAGAFFVFAVALSWLSGRYESSWRLPAALRPLVTVAADIYRLRSPRDLNRQVLTSLWLHIVGILTYAFLGHALGLNLHLLDYVLVSPLVFIFAAIPISFASWGVRELGAIWLFGQAGASREEAFALSVLFGIFSVVAALPGAWLTVTRSGTAQGGQSTP